jgi:hypothetical protein
MISKGIVAIVLSIFLIVVGAAGTSYVSLREPSSLKSYDYEFLLPGTAMYTFEYDKKVSVDVTTLDYAITHEIGVEPVGVGVTTKGPMFGGKGTNGQYTKITIYMPEKVNGKLLKNIVDKVISGEYILSASESDGWSIYAKEERKYPIIDAYALQEFIKERLGINPIGVSTTGVKIIVHMPQPIDKAQLGAIVNEFLQQST